MPTDFRDERCERCHYQRAFHDLKVPPYGCCGDFVLRDNEADTLRETPQARRDSIDDSDYGNRFSETERITSSLRFKSLAPAYRAFLGVLALIPPNWRGPLACFVFAIIGFLASQAVPELIAWIKSK